MGTTKKAKKTGSKFLEVKGIIIDRLVSIQGLMQVESDRKKKNSWSRRRLQPKRGDFKKCKDSTGNF